MRHTPIRMILKAVLRMPISTHSDTLVPHLGPTNILRVVVVLIYQPQYLDGILQHASSTSGYNHSGWPRLHLPLNHGMQGAWVGHVVLRDLGWLWEVA